jgi:hypothetical protein
MIVQIKNFGPIEFLQIDTEKDLHLIYGENAIGKSYATYLLYCLIKNIKNKAIPYSYYSYKIEEESKFNSFFKKQLQRLKKAATKKIDITEQYADMATSDFDVLLAKSLQNSLLNSFSSLKNLRNRFSNKNYEISLHLDNDFVLEFLSDDDGNIRVNIPVKFSKLEIIQKNTKSTKFSFYQGNKKMYGKPNEEQFGREMRATYLRFINSILGLLDDNMRDVYYLPASRSGLYQALNAFTPIIAELTQNRFFIQNKSIELPSLPEPLSDYFIDLSTVNTKNTNKEFNELISSIQKNILKGEVSYDDKKRQILFKPSNLKLELNLSESSSMVAEISPIVLYLKHILNHKYSSLRSRDSFFYDPYYARPNRREKGTDILFIEEPEAHLHPEVQVLLMEIFAKLVQTKVKVFITSHSNYMFNKLNNVILKKEIDVSKISVYHLTKSEYGTNQNFDMLVTTDGIVDENFQSTSENLYRERMETLD